MARMDFRWVAKDRLAGCSLPGMFDELSNDLERLQEEGVRHLVSLTESALEPVPEDRDGLRFHHFPIDDMGVPQPRKTESLCRDILRWADRGEPVAVHCKAGIGRTGTILACCLVTEGESAEDAVRRVRRVNSHYIQTEGQEAFLRHYEEYLRTDGTPDEADGSADTHPSGLPRLRLKPPTTDASGTSR